MYLYTSEYITLGTPIILLIEFCCFVCVSHFHFYYYYSCDVFTKVRYQYFLCIYESFAAEGKQQVSDTLEAVNC